MRLKKLLISAITLGAATTVLANGHALSQSAIPASEFNSGIYLGLQAGLGKANWDKAKSSYNNFSVSNDTGLAGRIFVGYDFTKYLAAEIGYTDFGAKSEIKWASTVVSKISTQIFDLVGKGKLPIVDRFDIYGKAGVGYVMSSGINKNLADNEYYIGSQDKQNNFGFLIGIGAEYYFTPNLWADVSWSRTMLNREFGETDVTYYGQYQPDPDFYALGIAYKFDL